MNSIFGRTQSNLNLLLFTVVVIIGIAFAGGVDVVFSKRGATEAIVRYFSGKPIVYMSNCRKYSRNSAHSRSLSVSLFLSLVLNIENCMKFNAHCIVFAFVFFYEIKKKKRITKWQRFAFFPRLDCSFLFQPIFPFLYLPIPHMLPFTYYHVIVLFLYCDVFSSFIS